jgi:hypothetical protein
VSEARWAWSSQFNGEETRAGGLWLALSGVCAHRELIEEAIIGLIFSQGSKRVIGMLRQPWQAVVSTRKLD